MKNIARNIAKKTLSIIKAEERKQNERKNINCVDIVERCRKEKVMLIQTNKDHLLNHIKKSIGYTKSFKALKVKDSLIVWIKTSLNLRDIIKFICDKTLDREIDYYRYEI